MNSVSVDFSGREAAPEVDDQFVRRWSTRSYSDAAVPDRDLAVMIEAARWSPSAYNEQPWRFYTSTAASRDQFLDLLVEANQRWAGSAPVIGFVVASTQFRRNDKDNMHADFDTGAAWMAFNLQASAMGYSVHGMAGIHYDRVYEVLGLDPARFRVICGFTVGVNAEAPEQLTGRETPEGIWFRV